MDEEIDKRFSAKFPSLACGEDVVFIGLENVKPLTAVHPVVADAKTLASIGAVVRFLYVNVRL